ncbi:T6SS immunity protein Tli4 family protein [Xenorhabdus szentirmaii]|uniref:T6SS immunity protein Tli4 family protein n=1 Tax=Xenorhabdus szentirmaii TaxID=290112 RepID=UPI00198837EE|nr:T6SS immunity protein Tli4 family protein [Xenorhabdus sp. 38]MBD2781899.1 hypothetical protein [Xenorhabdus sp. 38]
MKKKIAYILSFVSMSVVLVLGVFYLYLTKSAALTNKEKLVSDNLFYETKPQCIGNYVFDVPGSFVNIRNDTIRINESKIITKRMYFPAFEQRIKIRERQLNDESTIDPVDSPFLKKIYRLDNINGIIFDRNTDASVAGTSRILEGHLYNNGVAFTVTLEFTDYSDPKYADSRKKLINVAKVNENLLDVKPQALAEVKDLFSRLTGRKDSEIPAEKGTCIPDGFIKNGSGKVREQITMMYSYDNNFDFSVSTNNFVRGKESMLERSTNISSLLLKNNVYTLRKGERKLKNVIAEEWLTIGPNQRYYSGKQEDQILFNLRVNEKVADFYHPFLKVTLHNNDHPPRIYSDDQLVDIWDRLTESFRLR